MDDNYGSEKELLTVHIFEFDDKGNKIAGYLPKIINSSINFVGENNILYCDENVCLNESNLIFGGCNSLIYLGTSEHKIRVELYNDSVFHVGRFTTSSDPLKLIVSEQKHCFIGDNCMISYGVMIRNADGHLIYSCDDRNRINPSKSVYIGDHVWLGQFVKILKDTQIDSGSIVGMNSVVAGKKISHNSIWAGGPARYIKNGVFWDKTTIHGFTEEMTESSMDYNKFTCENREECHGDDWIYKYDESQVIEWDYLESGISHGTALEKCNFLMELNAVKSKNRFVHNKDF